MSLHIQIFCRSDRTLTRREIIQFILNGALIDKTPAFRPPTNSPEAPEPVWGQLELQPAPHDPSGSSPAPLLIERIVEKSEVDPYVEEGLSAATKIKTQSNRTRVEELIRATKQVFHIDLTSNPQEDVWEAIDAVEMLIARELDGVIQADEGFYDARLRLLG